MKHVVIQRNINPQWQFPTTLIKIFHAKVIFSINVQSFEKVRPRAALTKKSRK